MHLSLPLSRFRWSMSHPYQIRINFGRVIIRVCVLLFCRVATCFNYIYSSIPPRTLFIRQDETTTGCDKKSASCKHNLTFSTPRYNIFLNFIWIFSLFFGLAKTVKAIFELLCHIETLFHNNNRTDSPLVTCFGNMKEIAYKFVSMTKLLQKLSSRG